MKTVLLASLLGLLGIGLPGWAWLVRVREHNSTQAQGEAAARRGQAEEAALHFGRAAALAGRGGPSPNLLLNLGQVQALAGQQVAARGTYARLLGAAVPPGVASAARQQLASSLAAQGQLPQAIGLLRQALRLDPGNETARYNYELLSEYLAAQPTEASPTPAAGASPAPARRPPTARDSAARKTTDTRPKPTNQQGQRQPERTPAPAPNSQSQPPNQPDPSGQPNPAQPAANPGSAVPPRRGPGLEGAPQPIHTGAAPGAQRGLDASSQATNPNTPAGSSRLAGTEAATAADRDLQTQRERLRAMSLSPAQAQQLLDALRAGEQQYLQQRPQPRTGAAPAPGQPTW